MALEEEDEVRSVLREMSRVGALPPAPLTAAELRMKTGRRGYRMFDVKALVAAAVVIALVVGLFTAHHLKSINQSGGHVRDSPTASVAHSAYGLQLSVPRNWTVEVFGQCRDGRTPGTLFIGTSKFVDFCPSYGSKSTQVDMFPGERSPLSSQHSQAFRVNGVKVLSSPTGTEQYWYVPSKHVVVTGADLKALAIMRTLAPATRQAVPAVGQLDGSEYIETLVQSRVTGPITVKRIGTKHSYTVQAVAGHFSFGGRPGNYVLTGRDGNTPCSSVIATVISGTVTNAPPVTCDGT
jgi:hypothetical protein